MVPLEPRLSEFADSHDDKRVSRFGVIDTKLEFLPLDIFLESHDSSPVYALIHCVVSYRFVRFTSLGQFFLRDYKLSYSIALIGELERSACRAALPETELCRHWSKRWRGDCLPGLAETPSDKV
jgi:hypothetical protein